MSYKSPIEIVCGEMKNQLENDVYSVVQSYGIKVDKDELIKALEYDRNQYQQGYADAKAELERKKGEWVKDEHTYPGSTTYNYVCSACGAIGGSWLRDLPKNLMYPFCPFCGAEMTRGER